MTTRANSQVPIADDTRRAAIASGLECRAPLMRVAGGRRDFALYIESPAARVALVAAAARMMRQPLDTPAVRRAMRPGYRLWLAPGRAARASDLVVDMRVVSAAGELRPTSTGGEKLFLGTVPSHGIVPELRDRRPQFTFTSLPAGRFDVVVRFDDGVETYRIAPDQPPTMAVCNEQR